MVALSWVLVIGLGGGTLAVVDGIHRVRGTGTAVLAVVQVIVGAFFVVSFFLHGIPGGSLALGAATFVVSALQLFVRSGRRASVGITLVASAVTAIWIALADHWIDVPGLF